MLVYKYTQAEIFVSNRIGKSCQILNNFCSSYLQILIYYLTLGNKIFEIDDLKPWICYFDCLNLPVTYFRILLDF